MKVSFINLINQRILSKACDDIFRTGQCLIHITFVSYAENLYIRVMSTLLSYRISQLVAAMENAHKSELIFTQICLKFDEHL